MDAVELPVAQIAVASSPRPAVLPAARRLNLWSLIGITFFLVSGGAFGLEPLVGAVGPGWAVVLVVLTPIFWSLPIALMVGELASAMPEEGGYYVWVREGLGLFWGVQEGWWTICYAAVDLAIYPVLFVNYLAYFVPGLGPDQAGAAPSVSVFFARWVVALAVIAIALMVNWRGARPVGHGALVTTIMVLAPFAILVALALARHDAGSVALQSIRRGLSFDYSPGLIVLALSIVLWNYTGWDNLSTFAGEVNNPSANYPRALLAAIPLTVGAYVLPILAGVGITSDPAIWNESAGWPAIAASVGGPALGLAIAIAALGSAWALLSSQLLYVSRVPYVMARDGWLPSPLARIDRRTGVPTTALAICCAVSGISASLSFGKLVVLDILFYSAALALEFAALVALRVKMPDMVRPFRVPGGWWGIAAVCVSPLVVMSAAFGAFFGELRAAPGQVSVVLLAVAAGVALYAIRSGPARHATSSSSLSI